MQIEKEYTVGREISALRCESVGEYSLPDYNGDVKKVLLVKTQVYPSGKFVGDDLLEFSGSVGYEVVYVDGENNVTHAEFSTDYEAAMKINSDNYVDSDVNTVVSSYNMRLVGPRKFSVKCNLDSDVRISERREHSIEGDAFMEYEPEYVSTTAKVYTSRFASGEARDINEEIISLEGAIADEVEVLLCDIHPDLVISEKNESAVVLKGDLHVDLLYKNSDDNLKRVEKDIPYSEEVIFDGADEFDSLEFRLDTVNKKSSVIPTEDGVAISVSASVMPKVYAKKNGTLELVTDMYLKERGTNNEYSDFGYTEYICTENYRGEVDAKCSFSDLDIENISDIISTDASLHSENCEITDQGVKISGEIRFSAIACQLSEEGERVYLPIKFSESYERYVNVSCQICDNMHPNFSTHLENVKMDIDENGVVAMGEISASVSIVADKRQRCLGASYVTDDEYNSDDSVITVYYPDSTESLFDIAKKFHTSVGAIAESNRLTEAVFASSSQPLTASGVTKLLIK